jgi:hypothetical protein
MLSLNLLLEQTPKPKTYLSKSERESIKTIIWHLRELALHTNKSTVTKHKLTNHCQILEKIIGEII